MLNKTNFRAFVLALVALASSQALFSPSPVLASALPGGELNILDDRGQPAGGCPLKHTAVTADIAGFVGRVTVKQVFHNPLDRKIEAVYVFPLPQDAAVDDMVMTVGDRRIVGQIKPRDEARQVYEQAKAAGHVASLLNQERPNIFTQSVANIEPGVEVTIEISYVETLKYEDGQYEWVFPMVVGPRYIPGTPTSKTPDASPPPIDDKDRAHPSRSDGWGHDEGKKNSDPGTIRPLPEDNRPSQGAENKPAAENEPKGRGWSPDTDRVPDASRITPPVVKPGFRAGHDISLTIHLDAGIAPTDIRSDLHEINVQNDGPTRATITLKNEKEIPNKDFILHYRLATDDIGDAFLVHNDSRGSFFTLILQPPQRVSPPWQGGVGGVLPNEDIAHPAQNAANKTDVSTMPVVSREVIFVLDTSGSMSGFPIEKAKKTMAMAIDALRSGDTFNLITFAGDTHILWDKPRPNTPDSRREMQDFLASRQGGGGTEMMKAIEAALAPTEITAESYRGPSTPQPSIRIVCFMTDGYVGNDFEIIDAVKKYAATTRVFSFGIGNSVNRFLLDGMAHAGRGEAAYVPLTAEADAVVQRFHERILSPVLTDIAIDWGNLKVSDVYPQQIPDLFAAKPLMIHGRLTGGAGGKVTLRGRTASGPFERVLHLNARPDNHPALASLWARAKIGNLMMQDMAGLQRGVFTEDLKRQITELGLAYRLMTQFTSFVAVEEMRITVGGEAKTIAVPVEMPEGVSYEGVFGGGDAGRFGGGFPGRRMHGAGMGRPALAAPATKMTMERLYFKDHDSRDEDESTLGDAATRPVADPLSKLDADLRGLLDNLGKLGADGNGTINTLKIVAHRLSVMIVLRDTSPQTLNALKDLGFIQDAESKTVKLLIGTIDVRKLKELAAMQAVVSIRAVGP